MSWQELLRAGFGLAGDQGRDVTTWLGKVYLSASQQGIFGRISPWRNFFYVSRLLQQVFSVSRATEPREQGEPECSSVRGGEADSLENSGNFQAPGSSAKATSTGTSGCLWAGSRVIPWVFSNPNNSMVL